MKRATEPKPASYAIAAYTRTHWGIEPSKFHIIEDPLLPPQLTGMGFLKEIKLRPDGRARASAGTIVLTFPKDCLLAFTPDKMTRLYCVLTRPAEQAIGQQLGNHPEVPWVPLRHLATYDDAGQPRRHPNGRQAVPSTYPQGVHVQPVGVVEHVVYHTHKKGDGPSHYIHELGEETGIRPWLGRDRDGRLWWAGGNYCVTEPGICD